MGKHFLSYTESYKKQAEATLPNLNSPVGNIRLKSSNI